MRDESLKIDERTGKYLASTEKVLENMKILDKSLIGEIDIQIVVNSARNYYKDAKHYLENKDYATALASITYCEGLLDALRLLGLVEFSW